QPHPVRGLPRRACCVSVTACLVPPERVVVALNSYAAARSGGSPVADRYVAFRTDSRRRGIDADAGHTVRRRGHALDPALGPRHEHTPAPLNPLTDSRPLP